MSIPTISDVKFSMGDDLPVFETVDPPPIYTQAELQAASVDQVDPKLREAILSCRAGDPERASSSGSQLLREGVQADELNACLHGAAYSGNGEVVRMLLSAGVPGSLFAAPIAVKANSPSALAVLVRRNWDLNEEEDWCLPPLLG